jgi:GMP synthase-like glutamine amidotransferase
LSNLPPSGQRKVYIVGHGPQYEEMWKKAGFAITKHFAEADIVNFLGGADVSPQLYGERQLPGTFSDMRRDQRETELFKAGVATQKFLVGICRGGQFLNVMNGGRMWQDVDNHCKSHIARDVGSSKEYWVTSTHHQMMRPTNDALILMVADEATHKVAADEQWITGSPREHMDIEALFYQKTRSLCFQPHPEFGNAADCTRAFMMYVRSCYLDETFRKAS